MHWVVHRGVTTLSPPDVGRRCCYPDDVLSHVGLDHWLIWHVDAELWLSYDSARAAVEIEVSFRGLERMLIED